MLDKDKKYHPIKEGECRYYQNGAGISTECGKLAHHSISYTYCPYCGGKIVRVSI